jgi:hypothetical protein
MPPRWSRNQSHEHLCISCCCRKVKLTRPFEISKNGFNTLVTDNLVAPPAPAKATLALIYALTVDRWGKREKKVRLLGGNENGSRERNWDITVRAMGGTQGVDSVRV